MHAIKIAQQISHVLSIGWTGVTVPDLFIHLGQSDILPYVVGTTFGPPIALLILTHVALPYILGKREPTEAESEAE